MTEELSPTATATIAFLGGYLTLPEVLTTFADSTEDILRDGEFDDEEASDIQAEIAWMRATASADMLTPEDAGEAAALMMEALLGELGVTVVLEDEAQPCQA